MSHPFFLLHVSDDLGDTHYLCVDEASANDYLYCYLTDHFSDWIIENFGANPMVDDQKPINSHFLSNPPDTAFASIKAITLQQSCASPIPNVLNETSINAINDLIDMSDTDFLKMGRDILSGVMMTSRKLPPETAKPA